MRDRDLGLILIEALDIEETIAVVKMGRVKTKDNSQQ